jgi:hypothetical protein
LGLDKTKFDQGLNQAEKKASQFGNVIKKIGGFLAAAFSVAAIIAFTQKIITFSKEAMKAAAEIEGIKNAFAKLGVEGKKTLEDMKKAVHGTIMEDELMGMINKARSLGIPLKDLGKYMEFARNQARAMNGDVAEFANLMISAVGSKTSRGLKQMGVSMQDATAAFKDAGGIIGWVTKRLEETGTVADTTADKMAQLKVSGQELKEAWGAWLNKADAPNIFRRYYTDLFNVWADETKTFAQKANAYLKTFGIQLGEKTIWRSGQRKTEKERAAEGIPSYKGVQAFLGNLPAAGVKEIETLNTLNQKLEDYKAELNDTDIADKTAIKTKKDLINALQKQINLISDLSEKIERAKPITPITGIQIPGMATTALPGIQPAPGQPSESEKELANIGAVTEELQNQQVAVDILANSFDALFTSTEDGFKAMIDSIIKSIERLISELLARVVVLTILNILTGGAASFGTVLKAAFGIGGGGGVPIGQGVKGASGLTVPSGYPHDTFPAMLTSGETVLTAQESRNFNRSINVNVTGEIAGRVIALQGRRTEGEN